MVVRITDRGPNIRGRVLDLSLGAARNLGIRDSALACWQERRGDEGRPEERPATEDNWNLQKFSPSDNDRCGVIRVSGGAPLTSGLPRHSITGHSSDRRSSPLLGGMNRLRRAC
jgi:hypothetical protein